MNNIAGTFPKLNLGTWKLEKEQIADVVSYAINIGYRGIDCAYSYGKDFYVGKAIQKSGTPREELFITNKVWKTFRTKDEVVDCCRKSLKLMKLDYFDLYLVHWPAGIFEDNWEETNYSVWQGMEELIQLGLVKNIGVSNFKVHHLKALFDKPVKIKPLINQIEFHPGIDAGQLLDYCRENGIAVEAWSPLGSGALLNNDVICRIADNHNKSAAQICLRWCIEKGVIPVVRSSSESRLKENALIFDFELTKEEISAIDGLKGLPTSGFDADTNQPE